MVRESLLTEVDALTQRDPQLAKFLASIPLSQVWICALADPEPISAERLLREAFGRECTVDAAEIAALNVDFRASGRLDRVIEARVGELVHHLHIRCAPLADGERALVAVRDVTTERRLEEALHISTSALMELNTVSAREAMHLALADPLTGLPNRRAFDAALENACATGGFALALADMDRFKAVNDSLGHAVGDKVLQAVAERLRQHIRVGDFVGRLAGDEFAMILKEISTDDTAREAAGRILSAFQRRLDLGEVDLHAGLTVGVALCAPGDDSGTVYRKADLALHTAKLRQRGSIVVHSFAPPTLAAHDDLIAVKALLSGRQVPIALRAIVDRLGETVAHSLAMERPMTSDAAAFETVFATATNFGLAGDFISALLTQAFEAIEAAERAGPVHIRLPSHALTSDEIAERIEAAFEKSSLGAADIALELPLAGLADPASAAFVARLRASEIPLVLGDWDMGLAAFTNVVSGGFTMVKLDAKAAESLILGPKTGEVCRSAFRSLYTLSVDVCARNVDTEDLAKALFALGVSAAEGALFARETIEIRPTYTSAA